MRLRYEYPGSIPGATFSDYSPTTAAGQVIPIPNDNLKKSSIKFYWADSANNRQVTVAFSGSSGASGPLKANFNVIQPDCSFTTTVGEIKFDIASPPDFVHLTWKVNTDNNGIVWNGNVSLPSSYGFSEGSWAFFQIITYVLNQWNDGGTPPSCKKLTAGSITVLDKTVPYDNDVPPDHGIYTTESGIHTSGDSPTVGTVSPVIQANATQWFSTYLMFKPAGDNSCWVSLLRVDWWWKFCASLNSGKWKLYIPTTAGDDVKTPNPGAATSVADSHQPEWTNNISNFDEVGGPCAPPCSP